MSKKRRKKKKSTFEKITMIIVWIMLIFTIGGVILAAIQPMMH
ncbi:MAG: DUF4044 domain-containing protein [Firmicutes bacterium]|uniref:DUF4044 domain-containing protein n=1 Tax=Candidatus Gallilactobacillus intestinavium TaxID=2840838 RepID=A0A9D9E660_9LACO|nr:DUF4044 domain-containing protein [Candidatus Gallilactobacillus intestinavium]